MIPLSEKRQISSAPLHTTERAIEDELTVLNDTGVPALPYPALTADEREGLEDFDTLRSVYDAVGVELRETLDRAALHCVREEVHVG